MDVFASMTAMEAAALHLGLLTLVMLGIKVYVAMQRVKHKVPAGDMSNPAFGLATRVQLNAVEDVPLLMAGILGLALLGMPAWYVHMAGGLLVVSRIVHAVGLAGSAGASVGRTVGTFGTLVVFLAVAGALIVHAFG